MTSVLVVDECAADRQQLAMVLGYAGHTVLEAATGEEAVALAESERLDLIVADILMPSLDGFELVPALRGEPGAVNTPVIFCTATYAEDEVRALADASGVSHILLKPCEPHEITRVVGEALESADEVVAPLADGVFHREHLRVLNAKLIQKINELESVDHDHNRVVLLEAERRTAESLTLLETLQTTAPVGFGFVDRQFRIRRMNEPLALVNGASVEDQLGRRVHEVVPDIWPQIEPIYRRVLDKGEAVVNQETTRENAEDPTRSRVWLASYYPVRVSGEIIGIGLVVVDITERKQAEEFRSVVMDTMAEGLYVMDGEGRLLFMNAAGSKMLGWTEEELRGKPVHALIHFQHADGSPRPEEQCDLLQVRNGGEVVVVKDDAFTRKDGTIFHVAYSAAPLASGTSVRGVVVVFRDVTAEQAERTRVESELDAVSWIGRTRDAIEDDRLVLYSQPIVPLAGGDPREELLLRMVGREGEVILPGSFLPATETYGLIGEIDRWVAVQAIRLAADGRRVEANLSADSIGDAELLSTIERELRATKADPSFIVFEVTETALMRDPNAAEAFAHSLVNLGCGLALDDFGIGYGSFTYLKSMPVTYLKIDITFVLRLASNPPNQHLVKAIVSLAQGFGQQTIAEGVEDQDTLDLLREYGVDFAQGFHIGAPAPIEAMKEAATEPITA
jgi:PAS domain S-box-containing protein